ncbi:MAG: type II toxin-antitoxin system prevent-host-death family antitoxin, partial [Nakamurella sp.]
MAAITATNVLKSLFGITQHVSDDHTAVEVVSRHGNAVIISKDDYDAMAKTAYLLRTPANAERLFESIKRARRGEFEQHDLPGASSRRMDDVNRLVYYVTDDHIVILQ